MFVVVADAPVVSLVYLVLRELVALATQTGNDTDRVSVSKASSRIAQALTALNDLEEITRHTSAATKSLERIADISGNVRARVEQQLTDGLTALSNN
jgi:phosphate uptake regulator